jgi:hypothetical protein
LVPFLLGKIDVAALDEAAATPDVLRDRQQCHADFAAAVRALRDKDDGEFRSRMSGCAASPKGALEQGFCLARWEVKNGFPPRPFAGRAT